MIDITPEMEEILGRIPGYQDAVDVVFESMKGLTNTNYLVSIDGKKYVLRVGGINSTLLGINRKSEYDVLKVVEEVGIGPQVIAFIQPQGHLVTRYIEGTQWDYDTYRLPENLLKMVTKVKELHSMAPVGNIFSPFQRIRSFIHQAQAFGVELPEDLHRLISRMYLIEADLERDRDKFWCFCHNDLYMVNFMLDHQDQIRFIDWEFAGMGDIFFDLAALVYACESDGELPESDRAFILQCYFGEVTDRHKQRLDSMSFCLNLFAASWGLLQHGIRLKYDQTLEKEDFSYLGYSAWIIRDLLGKGWGDG
jgi:thiamine kinase-like enzyme